MNKKYLTFLPVLALACATTLHAADEAAEQAKLTKKAKITEADARVTASAKVPGGKVQSVEIEEENGKLVWSYDFTKAKSKNITEVQIDAMTGKVAAVEIETPKDIAKEDMEDAAHK